jgi:hypothetical protein
MLDQVSVLRWPRVTGLGFAVKDRVGTGIVVTDTVTFCAGLVPPAPEQVKP